VRWLDARRAAVIRVDAVWLAVEPFDMRSGTEAALVGVVNVFGAARSHNAYLFANRRAIHGKSPGERRRVRQESTAPLVKDLQAWMVSGAEMLTEYESSPNRRKCFCRQCGSQLFIRRLNRPDFTVVTLGTLDDDPAVRPTRHVFVGSKAPWHEINGPLPTFKIYPGDDSAGAE
jgi:hypothetical protein